MSKAKNTSITDFPKVTRINLVTRTASGAMSAPKPISIDEFNGMSGQDPIEWREDVLLDPEYQDKLPDVCANQFPAKGRSYLAKIQEAVAKTIPHLALIDANDAFRYSTITTKRFAAGELCMLYSGQYFPTKNTSDIYTIEVVDREGKPSGIIDAKRYRGYGAFMPSAPTKQKERPDIASLEDYDFLSVNQKTLAHTNVRRNKNFSFNNIPYIVYSNPAPIEPFTLLASDYGTQYFRNHDIIPLLSHANGLLLDSTLYTSKNIEFAFVQGPTTVVCTIPRSAVENLPFLNQGLKINVAQDRVYFISPIVLESLLDKYPPHSPFIRVEQNEYVILNPMLLSC